MYNARSPRITAAAGTRLAGTIFLRKSSSFLATELYDQNQTTADFVPATLLGQGCPHCPRFHTAAL